MSSESSDLYRVLSPDGTVVAVLPRNAGWRTERAEESVPLKLPTTFGPQD